MIVVYNEAIQRTFLKSRFVIFRCQKYVKMANGKKYRYIEMAKIVSQIALFYTTEDV